MAQQSDAAELLTAVSQTGSPITRDYVIPSWVAEVVDSSGEEMQEGAPLVSRITQPYPMMPLENRIVKLPPRIEPVASGQRFVVLNRWEGVVLSRSDGTFVCRLHDRTATGAPEEAEFDIQEVDDEDRGLICPGAIFYWAVGYLDRPRGRARASTIRFRRLPVWREDEIDKARRPLLKSRTSLTGDRSSPPAVDEVEVSLIGPGFGEAVVVHAGGGDWLLIDSCVSDRPAGPASLIYLDAIGVSPSDVQVVVATHWHDDHVRGIAQVFEACENAQF